MNTSGSRSPRAAILAIPLSLIAVASCRSLVPIVYQVEPTPTVVGCPETGCASAADQIAITYLGVSGFMVRHRGAVLLTAPFFTNPPLQDVAPPSRFLFLRRRGGVIRPDSSLIERLLP